MADGLTLPEKLALDNAIDDLLLPWKVDLAVWDWIDNPTLHDHIQRVGINLCADPMASPASDLI